MTRTMMTGRSTSYQLRGVLNGFFVFRWRRQLVQFEHSRKDIVLCARGNRQPWFHRSLSKSGWRAQSFQTYHVSVGQKTVKPPNRPARLAIPDPLLWRRLQDLSDHGSRIHFVGHGVFLAMLQSPLIFVIDGQVERVLGQVSIGSCDP